jgi:hypothetical protein
MVDRAGYSTNDRANVSMVFAHVTISATSIHSSSVCACAIEPGP